MQLSDLQGIHLLTGVEQGNEAYIEYEDCEGDRNFIIFGLDNKKYKAIEDPGDGYRSYMNELEETEQIIKNALPSVEVYCKMKASETYYTNDVLEMWDTTTNKLVLAIGTANTDDYYPYCVMEYNPKNMAINIDK